MTRTKAKPITKAFEVRFAVALLKALHANVNNYYLIIAIIAWTRDASGTHWLGNNPLKIGHGRRFATVTAAAYATAKLLLAGPGWYKTLVTASRRNDTTAKGQQTQALDFLTALALTDWDANHFGVIGADSEERRARGLPPLADITQANKNRLYTDLEKLSHFPIVIPAEPAQPAKQPPAPVPPNFGSRHNVGVPHYIEPYRAYGFYKAREREMPVVPSPIG